jgi:hypothetical protein
MAMSKCGAVRWIPSNAPSTPTPLCKFRPFSSIGKDTRVERGNIGNYVYL